MEAGILPSPERASDAPSPGVPLERLIKDGFSKARELFNLGYAIKLPIRAIEAEEARIAELAAHRWNPSVVARGSDRKMAMVRNARERLHGNS